MNCNDCVQNLPSVDVIIEAVVLVEQDEVAPFVDAFNSSMMLRVVQFADGLDALLDQLVADGDEPLLGVLFAYRRLVKESLLVNIRRKILGQELVHLLLLRVGSILLMKT